MKKKIACIILAAGASRRMGRTKALLPWGKVTLIQHLAEQVKASGIDTTVVVAGARNDELLHAARQAGIVLCPNPSWEKGMGSSLAAGLQWALGHTPDAEAILVLLADQPMVSAGYLKKMLLEHQKHPELAIATDYSGFPGVPTLFPKVFWESLLALPPGEGAKTYLRTIPGRCRILQGGDAAIDIDTPEAYSKALERAGLSKK